MSDISKIIVNNIEHNIVDALAQERIDNLITSGDVLGEETAIQRELGDIRAAFDGMSYTSAGNAVRGQASQLNAKINDVKSEIADVKSEVAGLKENGIGGSGATTEQIQQIETNKNNIENLSNEIDDIFDNSNELYRMDNNIESIPTGLWELGSFEANTGSLTHSNTRLRTRKCIDRNTEVISANEGYQFLIYAWDGDNYKGFYKEDNTFYPSGAYWVNSINFSEITSQTGRENYSYKLLMKKVDDSDITTADYLNVKFIKTNTVRAYIDTEIERVESHSKNDSNLFSLWEQGTFGSDGVSSASSTRIRTKNYISKQINQISADAGYQFLVYAWNGDAFVGFYKEDESFYPSGAYWVNYLDFDAVKLKNGRENYNYRLLLRKSDNSNISTDDYSKIHLIAKGSKKTVISGDVEQRPSIEYREGDNSAYVHGCMSEGLNINNLRLLAMKYENIGDVVYNNRKATTHEVMNYIINKNNFKTNGRLYKDGTLLKNADGKTVKLNGIGLHNILQYNNLHTIDGFKSLMYMGINMIRITVYLYPDMHLWANTGGYSYYGYLGAIDEHDNRIDELITMLTELGFYIVIDWHIMGNTMAEWYTVESQTFWHKYASKYATQGNIIWELANEPNNTSDNFTEYATFIKTSRDIIRSYDQNAICVAGALNFKPIGTYNAFKDFGIDDVFISQHYYTGSGTDGYDNIYCDFLVSGIPLFITEWGNAAEDGGNPPNNTASEEVLNFYNVSYVANSVWKFTDQDHLTSVLKNIGSHNSPLYFYGFSDGDLSYNGKFYFDNLREKMLDNPNTFDASMYLVNGKYITETGEIANSETGYVFANIPVEPNEKYHILLSGGKFIRCFLHNTNIMEDALEENNFVVSNHRDIVVESKDFEYITVCVTDIKSSSTSGWIRVKKE